MSQPNNSIKCKKPDSKKNQTERTCKICNDSFMGSGVAQCCSEKCVNANNIQWQRDSLVRKSKEKFTDKNPEMWVQCPECDLRTKMLTTNHLVQVHGISYEEFQGKYPNFQVTCKHLLNEQSESAKGDKNPGFNHGGKLSPFSKKFVGYSDYSDKEKESSIKALRDEGVLKKVSNNNDPKKVEYYIKRGASPEEAKILLSISQTTFSLDICMEKHGIEKGKEIWSERQQKWSKNFKKQNFSKISQLLFVEIQNLYQGNVYFATHDREEMIGYKNKEMRLVLDDGRTVLPDFYDVNTKRIIEFDGSYWHSVDFHSANPKREEERDKRIIDSGFSILHIKERDYKINKEQVIQECINFLNK